MTSFQCQKQFLSPFNSSWLIRVPLLTVLAGVGPTDGGHGGAARHDQLIRAALVVGGLGLGEDHVVHVEPGMTR